jgi:hypothetical protein
MDFMLSTTDTILAVPFARRSTLLVAGLALLMTLGCGAEENAEPETAGQTAALQKAAPGDKAISTMVAEDAPAPKTAPQPPGPSLAGTAAAQSKGRQRLAIGSVVREALTPDDVIDAETGAAADYWMFELAEPGEITLRVTSSDFNPLFLLAFGGETIEQYFGDEAVQYVIDVEAGPYVAIVGATPTVLAEQQGFSDDPGTGGYEISLDFRPASEGNHTAYRSMLHIGMGGDARALAREFGVDFEASAPRPSGELNDGTFFEDYLVELAAGEAVTVTMRSVQFDTYLLVVQNEEILASNDDMPGSTDSQITFTAPAAGTYHFRANSYEAGATGTFSIIIDR